MYWNYRVMRHAENGALEFAEPRVAIHEVYYFDDDDDDVDDLTITAEETLYTTNPIPALAFDVEDLRERLENMLLALDKPVLEYPEVKKSDDIPAEPAQPPQDVTVHLDWNQHGCPVVEPPFGACITLKVNSTWTYPDGTPAPPDVWISGTADGLRTLAQHILGIAETQSDNHHAHLDKVANEPFFKSPQGWQLTISKHPHG